MGRPGAEGSSSGGRRRLQARELLPNPHRHRQLAEAERPDYHCRVKPRQPGFRRAVMTLRERRVRGGASRRNSRLDWFPVWSGRGAFWDPEDVAFRCGSRLAGVSAVSHPAAVGVRWRGRRASCLPWPFTRKIPSPSRTARLEWRRRAARLVRPEGGGGRGAGGEAGVRSERCSVLAGREGKRWALCARYRAPEPHSAIRTLRGKNGSSPSAGSIIRPKLVENLRARHPARQRDGQRVERVQGCRNPASSLRACWMGESGE